ncbi:MAG: hypothetical protein LBH73_09125 [Spirochaetaceae bacterium]|jgi:hypothetical protein|nr:hypothetical protein [Spirochaetaceae bacterium]
MPSQILHLLFGEDVLAALYERLKDRFGTVAEEALRKIKKDYWPGFALGCQGPDIFYHNQSSRPVALEYGTLLHRRGYGVFTAALLKMALPASPPAEHEMKRCHGAEALSPSRKITALGAYALGFMTHAILDRKAHPYIVYKAARHHAFFERILDLTMLRLLRALDVSFWDQDALLAGACERAPPGLAGLLEKALVSTFPERAGKDEKLPQRITNTFHDAAFFYRLTCPQKTTLRKGDPGLKKLWESGGRPLNYIYPEKIPLDIDYLNLGKTLWRDPGSPAGAHGQLSSTASFPELYADAVEEAAQKLSPFIARYLGEGVFPIAEAARSIGNNSLSIQAENGRPCAPRCFDFLPLDRVLAQQERLRRQIFS